MKRVIVYLRNPLFSFGGAQAHLPEGAMVLTGELVDRPAGGVILHVERVQDAHGRALGAVDLSLFLPWAKVDHLQLLD